MIVIICGLVRNNSAIKINNGALNERKRFPGDSVRGEVVKSANGRWLYKAMGASSLTTASLSNNVYMLDGQPRK